MVSFSFAMWHMVSPLLTFTFEEKSEVLTVFSYDYQTE